MYVNVEDGQLYYKVTGHGIRPIIWVHGLPLNADSWYAQTQYFDSKYQNIVFDMRGYYRSSKIPDSVSSVTELYVQDLNALITALNLEQPIIVGFASGGHAALRFAALYPDKLHKLVLINSSPRFMKGDDWPWGFTKSKLQEFVHNIRTAPNHASLASLILDVAMREADSHALRLLKAWYVSMAVKSDRETFCAFFNNIAYDDDRPLLDKVNVPTLIIASNMGKEVPVEVGLYLRRKIKNSQLTEINNIDHFAFATKSNLINETIDQFIDPTTSINLPTDIEKIII